MCRNAEEVEARESNGKSVDVVEGGIQMLNRYLHQVLNRCQGTNKPSNGRWPFILHSQYQQGILVAS